MTSELRTSQRPDRGRHCTQATPAASAWVRRHENSPSVRRTNAQGADKIGSKPAMGWSLHRTLRGVQRLRVFTAVIRQPATDGLCLPVFHRYLLQP